MICLLLYQKVVNARGPGTTAISKVKGHADEGLVRGGRDREIDKVCNVMADQAAEFGRRRVGADVMDARRSYSTSCRSWNPVFLDLHRFFIAIARAVVNEDGKGSIAPHTTVWSAGGRLTRRRAVEAVSDYATLPGPQRLWVGSWFRWPKIVIAGDDVGRWPFSTSALVKLAACFLEFPFLAQ